MSKKVRAFWYPQSFFARTIWMVLLAVLFSKALTLVYLMVNEDVLVDRQYSYGTALTIRAYWASAQIGRDKISKATGLITVKEEDVPEDDVPLIYSKVFTQQMRQDLGPRTQVRIQMHSPAAMWVYAPDYGDQWIRLPIYPRQLQAQRIWNLLGWLIAIGLLSTAVAWVFVRHLNEPLKRLVMAARSFGSGRSVRLPISQDTASEMAEVYQSFNQMADDLERSASERELMLAGVSHDLRTPLTRLRLSLELMNADPELIDDMVRDVEDMNAILDQFLAFIRDGRDEEVETVNLIELVEEVTHPYNQKGEQRVGLCLEPVPMLPLRRLSMKRLLMNLIENALKYGGKGVEVTTSVEGGEEAPFVEISVLDRGAGVKEDDIEKLFNPFMRGESARTGTGTGLGLAIVRRIAGQHGGTVELFNRAGGGTAVRVRLPICLLLPRDAVGKRS
ncbi:ATP-binding protein [Pseudomonas sp. F1_0610]|uniref:ATP-binding protein n=1 Tax=Pseudomonas sp. F1_0610 TaxID=3114284 RepID=UPI0039C276F8